MKAILILDEIPENCLKCPLGKNMSIAIETCIQCPLGKCVIDAETETRPDWCPLKPKPEKVRRQIGETEWQQGFTDGWNSFIDEILGDKE